MKMFIFFAIAALFASFANSQSVLDPYQEYRYCGSPKRNADGFILRDSKVLYYYRKIHRCPSTGLYSGACPNYSLNHVVPLACGGCDAVWNLMWMRNDIKKIQDSIERKIYTSSQAIADTAACQFQITP